VFGREKYMFLLFSWVINAHLKYKYAHGMHNTHELLDHCTWIET
jgi:hypothetical protein